MPFSNQFPYTDLHEININKFLKAIKNLLGGHGGEFLKKKSNIPFDYEWSTMNIDYPVTSVNGQTGAVVLDADDVGALPDSYTAPVQSVNGQTGAAVLDADDVGALPTTTKYAESNSVAGPAKKTETIPYGECDSTSTATDFTATVPGITELKNGTIMLLKNGVVTSASGFTININGLGAKPSYSNMTTGNDVTPTAPTRDTTIFNINYTMLFIYDETLVSGGCWIGYRGYDSNTNTIGYQLRTNSSTMPVSGALYRYRLLFTSLNGRNWIPANTTNSTSADTTKTTNTSTIDPFGAIVYYGSTTTVSSGSRPSSSVLWQEYTLNIGYSFNTTGSAPTLTSYKPVYLKCSPQSAGGAKISSTPYVQTLPSSADNHIYIYLGMAYSATNIELSMVHPVYYHDGTSIKLWTGGESSSGGAVDSVNGQTGTVVLDADDVGALANTVVNGKTVKVVAGVARYVNGEWTLLNDTGHNPLNAVISAGQTDPGTFTITHNVGATKVLSLVCGPDESYAKQGLVCGASVGLDTSIVNLYFPFMGASAISYNGSSYLHTPVTAMSTTDIVSTISVGSHATLGKYLKLNLTESQMGVLNLFPNNKYDWKVLGYGPNYINVQPWLNGVRQSLPLPAGDVSFSIGKQIYGVPSSVTHTNCNVWFLGIFEI